MFLKLALKNLIRNRRRTIITKSAIALGTMVIIIASGFIAGIQDNWQNSIIEQEVGHLQLMKKEFSERSKMTSEELVINYETALTALLDDIPGIEHYAASLSFSGLIAKDDKTTTFFGSGVELPEMYKVLPQMRDIIVKGRFPEVEDHGSCVIGSGLAKNIGAVTGDLVVLMANTIHGQVNAVDVEILGIMRTGIPIVDESLLITNIDVAQSLLDAEQKSTKFIVQLQDIQLVESVKQRLDALLPNGKEPTITAFTWMDLSDEYKNVKAMFDLISIGVAITIFFLVGIGIANNMLMNVLERTNEIGVMMAMGAQKSQILLLFVLESIVLALGGTLIGILLGIISTSILGEIGIPFTPPDSTIELIIMPRIVMSSVYQALVLSLVMSTIASIYPALHATRLDPAEIFSTN